MCSPSFRADSTPEMWCHIFTLSIVVTSTRAVAPVLPIGGIFHPTHDSARELAFRYAADRINMDKSVLPDSTLVPISLNVSETNSLDMERKLCDLTDHGVAAVLGPHSSATAGIVQGICEAMEIPNLQTFWVPESDPSRFLLNMHPHPIVLAKAARDVVLNVLHWKRFVVLYETEEGLMRLQEILKAHGPQDNPVTVRQLDPKADNRPLLKDIQYNRVMHIVLDCDVDNLLVYLRQARDVNMLQDYVHYFIMSLDTHTIDLSEFKSTPINITALQLVDPSNIDVINAVEDWKYGEMRRGNRIAISPHNVRVEAALMYDAVNLFAKALHQLNSSQRINIKKISCTTNPVHVWQHGFALFNYMKLMVIRGMTGFVKFDTYGRRIEFQLNVIEYTREQFKTIGTWDVHNGIVITRTSTDKDKEISQTLQNKTFIVTSRKGKPYLGLKQPTEGRVGNDRFEGYSIDLITKIAEIMNFKFEFQLTEDNSYPGLIKDLLNKRADLAICDLTITKEREQLVDFTMPFMELGISILYAKPTVQHPSLFSFLDPLSSEVWLFMATAYLGISIILYVLARTNPNEWSNPHPCNPNPKVLENRMTMLNSMWCAIGSLMRQGSDILPKASRTEWSSAHPCLAEPEELTNHLTMINSLWHNVGSMLQQGSDVAPQAVSTRAVAAMWWFFILIMISSYTANLAASLTLTRTDNTIESVEDLAKQSKIKYGTVMKGSTRSFFEKSNHSTYHRMYAAMVETRPSVFVVDNAAGVDRVKKGKNLYAFFMESTQIEYETERNCNLTKVGGQLDNKGYGIALPMHSPYRTLINRALLDLQAKGVLRNLKNKWWKEMGGGSCGTRTTVKVDSTELGMPNVGGVFLVLMIGCVIALCVAILEMLWNCRRIAVQEAITPWEALILELKFAIKLSETKPVRKKSISQLDKSKTNSAVSLDFDKYPNK